MYMYMSMYVRFHLCLIHVYCIRGCVLQVKVEVHVYVHVYVIVYFFHFLVLIVCRVILLSVVQYDDQGIK